MKLSKNIEFVYSIKYDPYYSVNILIINIYEHLLAIFYFFCRVYFSVFLILFVCLPFLTVRFESGDTVVFFANSWEDLCHDLIEWHHDIVNEAWLRFGHISSFTIAEHA